MLRWLAHQPSKLKETDRRRHSAPMTTEEFEEKWHGKHGSVDDSEQYLA